MIRLDPFDLGMYRRGDGHRGLQARVYNDSPTMQSHAKTEMGLIVGTAAYMSAEQSHERI
jgi:hypothetical protein